MTAEVVPHGSLPADSRSPREASTWRDPALWGFVALALALRVGAIVVCPYRRLDGDEDLHYVLGVLTAHLGPYLLGNWAPAYEAFLAGCVRFLGPDPARLVVAQATLSVLLVVFVHGLAHRAAGGGRVGRRAARIAAALAAVFPSFVAYGHYFYNETLFMVLVTAGVHVARAGEARGRGRLAIAGVLFGLAILTRSILFGFLPMWVVWSWLRGRRAEARRVLMVGVVALLTLTPWTVRNALKYDGFLLVDGSLGRVMFLCFSRNDTDVRHGRDLGYTSGLRKRDRVRLEQPTRDLSDARPLPPVEELMGFFPAEVTALAVPDSILGSKIEKARERAVLDLGHRQRVEIPPAIEYVREYPQVVLASILTRFYGFWGPNSFLLRSVHKGGYRAGPLGAEAYPLVKWGFVAAYMGIVLAAGASLGRRAPPRILEWGFLYTSYFTLFFSLTEGNSRYRLPVMPLLIVMAAVWFAAPSRPEPGWRTVLTWGTGAGFVALALHYVVTVLP